LLVDGELAEEGDQAADTLSAELLKAAGRWRWALVLTDGLRRLIRPVSTIALVGGALYVNWLLIDHLTGSWPELDKMQPLWVSGRRFQGSARTLRRPVLSVKKSAFQFLLMLF
jgi:hypothetical protein